MLLVAPLVLIATEVSHALAYRFAYENQYVRAAALAEAGHGHFVFWTDALGPVLALLLATLVLRTLESARCSLGPLRIRLWWFVLLPALAFAAQEHLERLVHTGTVPWNVALEPVFLIGLALQLPIGVAAYVLGRFALMVSEKVGRALLARRPRLRPPSLIRVCAPQARIRIVPLARRAASRAPPLLAR